MPTTSNTGRISSMDALRALAMFLGLVLHASMAFMQSPFEGFYHVPDYSSPAFDAVFFGIHIFRMQLFYVIAGFFFRLLYYRIGVSAFMKHRTQRILLPLLVGLFTILPLTYLPAVFYRVTDGGTHFSVADFRLILHDIFIWRGPLHLWFLYYLMMFYILGLGVRRWGLYVTQKINWLDSVVQSLSKPAIIVPLLTVGSFITLLLFSTATVEYAPGLIPKPSFMVYYGLFFYAGWLLHEHMGTWFPLLRRYCVPFIMLGTATAVYLFRLLQADNTITAPMLLIKMWATITTLSLVIGLLGVFLKWVNAENATVRYLSDASYWVYLVHVALVNATQLCLGQLLIPGPLKFMLCVLIPLGISLLTYQWFVRYTVVGYYLHGSRKKKSVTA